MKRKMHHNTPLLFWIMGIMIVISCNQNKGDGGRQETSPIQLQKVLLIHADLYPVQGDPIMDGAVAIHDGKIVEVGKSGDLIKKWEGPDTELIDCKGAFLMPGFIEGHGHFSSLGFNLINVDLMETRSWQDVVDSVANRVKLAKPGEWILGRGWHQEKWISSPDQKINGYPLHDKLSAISPNNPVMLSHASGHSLFANEAAMDMAAVSRETPDPQGGHIVRDGEKMAVGVFEERAMDIIQAGYKNYQNQLHEEARNQDWYEAIDKAQTECLKYGITSFQDAGSSFDEIKRYRELAKEDSLDLRLWVMLRHPHEELKGHMEGFPILNEGKDMFTCRAIKSEVDGALGSFGAWLLKPYSDKPGFTGQNTTPIEDIRGIAEIAAQNNMQLCVHAIGDKANREVLNIFEEVMNAHPEHKDLRWRIEHAQHVDPADMPRFKQLAVIASMQGIHCTSDAPFVEKRLGEERARTGAYAWRSLLDQGIIIANGTDAPVERVDPIPNFYASVTRKRLDNGMEFFPEQKMTREEALYSYTLGNAYAGFEENKKGSIEEGKHADLVLLSQNLMTCADDSIPTTRVLMTMVGGEIKYKAQ